MMTILEHIDNWFFQLAIEKAALTFVLFAILVGCCGYLIIDDLINSISTYKRRVRLESSDEFEYMNDLY